jgi:4,5-dihydroxyphthalate decarboxylase
MTPPRIRFASSLYDRMIPLYAGEVRAEGIDLDFVANDTVRQIFDQMAGKQAFDASELSASEFITRYAAGDRQFVAIPVFPSKVFRHGFICVNTDRIAKPADLAGKRIGIPLWTMTAGIWIRGHLMQEFGVDLSGVTWVQGAINAGGSHGNPAALPAPEGVRIEVNASGRSLSDLLAAGEIDATLGTSLPAAMKTHPTLRRLLPDFRAHERAYYQRTGIFPIMHLVAIRREVYEAHPEVASSLYRALDASKAAALKKMGYLGTLRYMLPWLTADLDELDEVFGGDPFVYGLEPNRRTLEQLIEFMVEQRMIAAPIPVDDLFVPVD